MYMDSLESQTSMMVWGMVESSYSRWSHTKILVFRTKVGTKVGTIIV